MVEWGEDGYMKTKFTVSGFEYFPQLDRNLLYSAIADHGSWFDTWPGMAELDYMAEYKTAHDAERPLAITYGDGSEMTREGNKLNLTLTCESQAVTYTTYV